MKIFFLSLVLSFGLVKAKSQDLSGEWKGIYEQENFGGKSYYVDMNLIFFPLTDTTYEVYTFTMFPYALKDTVVNKVKGFMAKKNNLILEEVKAINV